jgi:putative ABC transport system permease protein
MLKNYLKIAFRALWRSKSHSTINILGLSLGIACCVLIVLFVYDEWTFDTFHSKADRIYRVFGRENYGENQDFFYTTTPFPMGPALKENILEVERFVRIVRIGTQVRVGDNLFTETITVGDRDLFQVFDFELTKGEREGALANQSNIVISDWAATKYFGTADPIGKVISVQLGDVYEDFTVSGVTRIPTNSSIQFYLLIPDHNLKKMYTERVLTSAWFNINPETYVLLRDGVTAKTVTDKFPSVFKTILGEEDYKQSQYAPGLQPLTSIHLDPSYPVGLAPVSNPRYAYILSAIALLILFVACINFVTLSVGRSLKRAKEVGIRKVVGAARQQLIAQFIGEAVLVTFIAMVLGVVASYLCLPMFNELSGKQLVFPWNGLMVGVIGSLLLIIGLIAGSYPAFFLSGFRPIAILKGGIQSSSSKQGLRKALVGVQLVLSIFLISSTLVMRNQLDYLQNKNLGFDKEQLIVAQINVSRIPRGGGRMAERIAKGFEQAEQFKLELAKFPDIAGVCAASHDFANGAWVNVGYTDDKGTYRTFNINVIDVDYLPLLKMEMVAGRNFSDDQPADKRRSVIVNEAFAKAYGWTDPMGKKIPGKNFIDHEIIGVVKDFNYASLYTKVDPLVMVMDPTIILSGTENINVANSPVPKLMVKIKPGNMNATLDQIKRVWDKLTGGEEFAFTFVDEALNTQYRADQNLGKIVSIATLLAIIIGSLGLYGLASLAMQNRVKEISIRKVLGATEQSLLVLLSREYVYLIALCLMLSIPATVYLMQRWLKSFEYRIEIGAGVFLLAGGISLLIAVLTISYQTIRTAWTQPAETLKYE